MHCIARTQKLFMMRVCVCVCACACVRVCVCVCVCVVIVHWHCSAQLSMFNMEKRYRNKIIIIITIKRFWHSCPRRVNASNKNTTSIQHPWRWNVTTSVVGLKNGHIRKSLTQNGEPQRHSWGTQKKEKDMQCGERRRRRKTCNVVTVLTQCCCCCCCCLLVA